MDLNNVSYIDGEIIGGERVEKSDLFKMPDQWFKILDRKNKKKDEFVSQLQMEIEVLKSTNTKKDKTQIRKIQAEIKKATKKTLEQQRNIQAAVQVDQLRYFCPNGAQERMIESTVAGLRSSKIPVLLMTCGNGVGKTTFAVQMMSNIIYGPQNGWFDYDVIRNWDKPKLCWYISSAEALSETVTPMIDEAWSAKYIKNRKYEKFKDGKKFISRIETNTGWTIIFKTYDQDPSKFESAQVGLLILDEPAPLSIWKAVKSRRRKGCLTMLPMTPLYTPPYIVDEVKKAISNKKKGYHWVQASVYEASMDEERHGGVRGHLDHDTIEEMVEGYDPDETEARIYGKLMYFSGRIFPEFSENVHVREPYEFGVNNRCSIIHAVDPHDSRPCACIYVAVTPKGMYGKHSRIIVFDETPNDEEGRKKDLEFWDYKKSTPLKSETASWENIEKTYKLNRSLIYRVLDKRFGWQSRGKTNFYKLFGELDYHFSKSYSTPSEEGELMYGHTKIKNLLARDEDGIPFLIIHSHCRHMISAMKHYIRRKKIGRAGQDQAEADGQIVEKYKDFIDVLRYAVVAAITPAEKRGKSEKEIMLDNLERERYLKQQQGFRYDDY